MRKGEHKICAVSDSRPPPSILVVENEARIACGIQSSLIRLGYDVPATAASPAEALEAVEVHRPDLIVMDVRLEEDTDGIAAAAAIGARYPTPIVFLTAHSDDAILKRAQDEAQPYGYLFRPYKDSELRAAIEIALKRHRMDSELRQHGALLAGILGGMSDAVAAADIEGNIVLVNEAGSMAFGEELSVAGFLREGSGRVYLPDQQSIFPKDELPLARALAGETVRDVELFIRSERQPDGRWYSVNAHPLLDSRGLVCGAVEVGRDVTAPRAARSELQLQSETDALTGLHNRRGFMQVASTAFDIARQSGRQPAVFFIDLNGMKRTNDSLGHPEGDRLLMDLAWILRASFRTSDVLGRLGGDEFVVLAPDAGGHGDVLRERLRAAVDKFNESSSRSYRISVSIGLSTSDPSQPASLEDLVEQADKRMYEDKLIRCTLREANAEPEPSSLRFSSLPPPTSLRAPTACIPPPRPATIPSSGAADPRPRTTHRRLLIVDDDPRNLALLERCLAPLGHELVQAEDGQSALKAFDGCKPDLVLLDLVMPGLDGLDVLAHIRRAPGDDHVPVIVLTAHSEREIKLRGLEAGADDFIEKPADARSLRVRVTTLMQLKESRDTLRSLNEELESRNAELSRLQREQRELTAFVVHDLKNPLAAVWSDVEFARSRLEHGQPDIEEALGEAAISCGRLRSMIDDLMVISRLEDADLPLHNQLVLLWDLLREVFGEFARRAAEKHVTLLGPKRTNTLVHVDRPLLQRVIENILDNSLRYTPEHGRMGITTRDNGEIEIAVSNTGPPIPPFDRQRIFEKFARIEKHGAAGNAGLGLYFCKRVVEALGGSIEVIQTSEWPTSFVVRLPAVA